jgi:hypothetical protein
MALKKPQTNLKQLNPTLLHFPTKFNSLHGGRPTQKIPARAMHALATFQRRIGHNLT